MKSVLGGGAAILFLLFSSFCARPVAAQGAKTPAWEPYDLASNLRDFGEVPAVSGYENQLADKIRRQIAQFHPVTDNLGDVIVTIGSGVPHRLIVTPIDEPGFVVSGITDDGYLRLQRLPQSGLPPIYNELYSAQPVRVGIAGGQWIDGVAAGLSIHLQNGRANSPKPADIENMYVDIGASSAAEARRAGVDILSPVAINRQFAVLAETAAAGASIGDKFGAAALLDALQESDAARVHGTLTLAFVVEQRIGARGLQRILTTGSYDEIIYVGRMLAGGAVAGMEGVHRAPRREPGSGVLVGLANSSGGLSGFAAELKPLADANGTPLATDYSTDIIPASSTPPAELPARSVHIGIATAWPDTPAETVDSADLLKIASFLKAYIGAPATSSTRLTVPFITSLPLSGGHAPPPGDPAAILAKLVRVHGASQHEGAVARAVKQALPGWAKPETDDAGNLILHLGAAPESAKAPKILIVAHQDEIGFHVKSISSDGRLEVQTLGGMDLSFYEGHPILVHSSAGDRDAIMELPRGWDEQNFQRPPESGRATRVDVGARSPEEVAKLGIKVGDSLTIPKEYRRLLGTRANARSFDDRVGCAALISAVWALGGPLKDRDVTFVWSTGEEIGLVGAAALAKRLAAERREPEYVFAVDTLVSSDSPLESKRFADAELGKGFAVRAVDGSNIVPRELVERVVRLAHANQIPVQLGVTGGGNDGSAFVPYGAVDIALGWPLRYSHSPAEVIDTRDLDALARIVAAVAKSW
ncbi:MAG TPA: M20/M25/M40 family metallo-hydrolase [Candidatus Acidoferrales bacterium]|nr:M20/M25/M40 family metallo-hydrolase [Candidatus Acidoferrales bacterium]